MAPLRRGTTTTVSNRSCPATVRRVGVGVVKVCGYREQELVCRRGPGTRCGVVAAARARRRPAPCRLRGPIRATGGRGGRGPLRQRVDVVLVHPPGRARQTAARHLSARARERQAALVVLVEHAGAWQGGGDLALTVGAKVVWEGIGRGHGHLRGRRAEVRVSGRRAAGRAVECSLWLPAGSVPRWPRRTQWRTDRTELSPRNGPGRRPRWSSQNANGTVGRRLVSRASRGRPPEGRRPGVSCRSGGRAPVSCVPWVHPIRLGVCAPAQCGPARFFGGEEMVVSRLGKAVEEEARNSEWPMGSSPPFWPPGPG